jgi:hypoxanthine-guanine phosphoribosyltransferase
MSDKTIITPTDDYVKQCGSDEKQRQQPTRIKREQISKSDIDISLRSLARHIARNAKKKTRVHIPAMRGSEWGQVLRTLEMKRAFN